MAKNPLENFLVGLLPDDCSESPAIIGLPKGHRRITPPPEYELEVRLNLFGDRQISRAYFKYSRICSWEEGPVGSDEIRTLAGNFAGGSNDIRIAGEVINGNTTSMLKCKRTGRDYSGSFDVSIYRGRYSSENNYVNENQYCMKDLLKAVFEILGIGYRIDENKGLLKIRGPQQKLKLTPENVSRTYQFLYDRGFMPVWIDGLLRGGQDGEPRRKFSIHNHFYRRGDGQQPLFSKTLSVKIDSGDTGLSLTNGDFGTLENALTRHGFNREKFDYQYLSSPPMTIID